MKKIIFSGFCMLTSVIGIMGMIFVTLHGNKIYGPINGSADILTYLNWYRVTPLYITFCLLCIFGLSIGIWGILDKNDSK